MAGGQISIALKNAKQLKRRIDDIDKDAKTETRRTLSDVKRALPPAVSKAVRKHYGISAGDMKGQVDQKISGRSAGRIAGAGDSIASLRLVYQGRRLTHAHYKLQPGSPTPRKLASAIITKGRKKIPDSFVGTTPGGGRALPFQRTGKAKTGPKKGLYAGKKTRGGDPIMREPLKALRGPGIPQFIAYTKAGEDVMNKFTGPDIMEEVGKAVDKVLTRRLNALEKRMNK